MVWQERETRRVAGNHDVCRAERTRCESWGQVLGTHHGRSEPNGFAQACNVARNLPAKRGGLLWPRGR